jgi:hypothetical protein
MVPQNLRQPIGLPSRQRQAYRKRPLLMHFHLGGGTWPLGRPGRPVVDVFKGGRLRTLSLIRSVRVGGSPDCCSRTRDLTRAWAVDRSHVHVSKGPESHRVRECDLAVRAEAITARTAATAMAMSQRTQSMPGLPLPPNAV